MQRGGGLKGAPFTLGAEDTQDGAPKANTWHGRFPFENAEVDGWVRTAPVGTFEPNGYGLYDMAGDVWEWSDDWYRSTHTDPDAPACCIAENPRCGTVEASLVPCSRSLRSFAGSSRAARTCVPELLPAL